MLSTYETSHTGSSIEGNFWRKQGNCVNFGAEKTFHFWKDKRLKKVIRNFFKTKELRRKSEDVGGDTS